MSERLGGCWERWPGVCLPLPLVQCGAVSAHSLRLEAARPIMTAPCQPPLNPPTHLQQGSQEGLHMLLHRRRALHAGGRQVWRRAGRCHSKAAGCVVLQACCWRGARCVERQGWQCAGAVGLTFHSHPAPFPLAATHRKQVWRLSSSRSRSCCWATTAPSSLRYLCRPAATCWPPPTGGQVLEQAWGSSLAVSVLMESAHSGYAWTGRCAGSVRPASALRSLPDAACKPVYFPTDPPSPRNWLAAGTSGCV